MQCENGVRTFSFSGCFNNFNFSARYYKKLYNILREIRKNIKEIKAIEPKESILTIHAKKEIKKIYKIVKKFDKKKELCVLWGGEAFDIGHKKVTKGFGLRKFCKRYKIKKQEILCIGDKENDLSLFKESGISVTTNPKLKADYCLLNKKLPGLALLKFLLKF